MRFDASGRSVALGTVARARVGDSPWTISLLLRNFHVVSGLRAIYGGDDCCGEMQQIGPDIGWYDDDRQAHACEILLVSQILIRRNEDLEPSTYRDAQ